MNMAFMRFIISAIKIKEKVYLINCEPCRADVIKYERDRAARDAVYVVYELLP